MDIKQIFDDLGAKKISNDSYLTSKLTGTQIEAVIKYIHEYIQIRTMQEMNARIVSANIDEDFEIRMQALVILMTDINKTIIVPEIKK